jgi:pimeloyl-ACP methyl ester carboxylesterase
VERRSVPAHGDGEPIMFASFDGVRISYTVLGDGSPTLLLHGFGSDSVTNWQRTRVDAALTGSARRVVLVDARGHGRSDKPHDVASYAGGAMVRDVRELLDRLQIGQVDVVGYSMGSIVAMRLVLADRRVRALVLGGIGRLQASVFDRARSERIATALEADDKSTITDPVALAFRNFADATKADRLALAAVQRARTPIPSEELLASIEVPTLVVNGTADTLIGDPASVAEAIPGAELVMVPGDHLSAVTKPEFAKAVVNFLDLTERKDKERAR